jgi:hypothetical protein
MAGFAEGETAFREQLRVVPVRNERAVARPVPGAHGELEVEVPLEYRSRPIRFLANLFRLPTSKRYHLDALGSSVLEMIDGRKNFENLADEFAAIHKLTFFEARALLAGFFQMLAKRGIIVAAVPVGKFAAAKR